jgi:hypothetical protein
MEQAEFPRGLEPTVRFQNLFGAKWRIARLGTKGET